MWLKISTYLASVSESVPRSIYSGSAGGAYGGSSSSAASTAAVAAAPPCPPLRLPLDRILMLLKRAPSLLHILRNPFVLRLFADALPSLVEQAAPRDPPQDLQRVRGAVVCT